jgi:D-alanine-D-alanine ligase
MKDFILTKDSTIKKKKRVIPKSLGPVSNLEEHVKPDWWQTIFNPFYLKTDGDVVNNDIATRREIDLFVDILNLTPEDAVLDLCCGHGRHSLELARRGFKNIHGLDRSRYLIRKAKNQANKEGLSVKFREGDARRMSYPDDSFDFGLILGNSFGYFETIKDDLRVLKEIFRKLKPHGKLLIDVSDGDFMRDNFQPRSWEWIDRKSFVCRERSLSLDGQKLISREIISDVAGGVVVDQFYSERLYSRQSLTKLLEEVGFSDVTFHGAFKSDSERNQDLGMMEKRIIVTAVARKEWTPRKITAKQATRNVAVLFGDPRKNDPVKPLGVFSDDDFYTIDQLKGALKEIEKEHNYRFSYLDNHDTLISALQKLKQKNEVDYIFNLCDEGFYNDARKELHVPALLEILGIPYTGSGPQCLAFCYDKSLVRGVASEMRIASPDAFFVKPENTTFEIPFKFPVLVKPNFGDSSFGITQKSVANTIEEVVNVISDIREKFGYDKPILVEEFLAGKDLSLGIIGNPPEDYRVLPIIEEDYSSLPPDLPRICGYEAKWLPDSPYWKLRSLPANLPDDVEKSIVEGCLELFERFECRDYCRFDLRLDSEGTPKLLEINPNPGWVWDGHLAKMCKLANISYKDMLWMILQSNERRMTALEV